MNPIPARFIPHTFAILRIMAGLLFAMHGTQKLFGWPPSGRGTVELVSLRGAAGIIELVAGTLIVIGLFTGLAAFIASGQMAAAYFISHTPQGWIPLLNRGELAALYCFLFLYMAAHGSGIWSLDARRERR